MADLPKIYLASKSPRRREIIADAGFQYELIDIEVEETYPTELEEEKIAEFLAIKKANAIAIIPKDGIVLTADTVVILDGEILGKPIDKADAINMLTKLSGKKHIVITGICMKSNSKTISFSDHSEVYFSTFTIEEIEKYTNTEIPYDKAGSYGIQDGLGMVKVHKIIGSYFNIMGLPIHRVYEALENF